MADKVIKKRQYSRNGCKECKRRKLKCDEAKPECWQCSHLGKTCVYVKAIKFSETRNLVADPAQPQNSNSRAKTAVSTPGPGSQSIRDSAKNSPEDTRIYYNVIDFSNTTPSNAPKRQPSEEHHLPNNGSVSRQTTRKFPDSQQTHISPPEDRRLNIINEASTLAQDIIESINPQFDEFLLDFTGSENVKKQDAIESFNLSEPYKSHLEIFYDKISAWLLPLDQQLCNDILLLHAKTSPYLLAAMLSLATKDEDKSRYFVTCLKSLSEVFQDSTQILSNIEPLILTILLLGSDSSSGNWRAHLRGAKDLFMKYIRFYDTTPSLLLAKSWFAAIEILAGLQNVGTGKVHELDQLLDVGLYGDDSEQGVGIGLLLPNGYNMFLGYSSEALVMYREYIKLRALDDVSNKDLLFLMSLIHSAKEFQAASANIKIMPDNPTHPEFVSDTHEKVILPWSCYGFMADGVYSWFDLIHQLHVDALLLHVYNEFYGLEASYMLCQGLVHEMLDMCFFFSDADIPDSSDTRLLMLQGPMLKCGMNVIEESHKEMVSKYFECLIKCGVQSAKSSFKRIVNRWAGAHENEAVDVMPFA
ncbi:CYFA0S02e06612g1_1 [Cyberlindnera fabianii]|uniref:CYFA0S02e06612g1_1 n=1 Tax=Cyberlindnera fabianii TaxID=36022 RepID=A0A061AMQ0_CYBFA|nr:Lysine biosynthesis regulatory protein LYS14 [Cyberlindnera fabianii]CDR38832.1 CYFA0S02e06612g1_1 [Cyberlindnera fabianii]